MAVSPSVDRPAKPAPPREVIPPLVDGERLTRDEFERRYDAMPDLKKAELIEGVVHMPSPVRHDQHSNPHSSPRRLAVGLSGRDARRGIRPITAASGSTSATCPSPTRS